jgi:uncharacterized protein YdiU (UPF0061 family)
MHRFGFDNTYARELPDAGVAWRPATAPEPRLLFANPALVDELGLPPDVLQGPDAAALFAGNLLPEDAEPFAQAYAESVCQCAGKRRADRLQRGAVPCH